jgi:bacterioferritin-associated ferredoxin
METLYYQSYRFQTFLTHPLEKKAGKLIAYPYSVIAEETLQAANIHNQIWSNAMYVCVCNAINDRQVKSALQQGKHSLSSLRQHLGFTSSCGRCTGCLRKMIDAHTWQFIDISR